MRARSFGIAALALAPVLAGGPLVLGDDPDDRTLAVTQGGECQTGAGEHGQQEQDQQTQPRPLAPVTESAALSVTLGQLQGAGSSA